MGNAARDSLSWARWFVPPGKAREGFLAHYEWIGSVAGDVDPDAFRLQVFADGVDSAFSADSGALVAPEGRHVADGAVGVHPHGAGFEAVGHGQRAADAFCHHAGGAA